MPESPTPRTLFLIDGHAQFFRAYYAIRSGMTSPVTGEPTNLTFGFVGMMLKLLREYRPEYLAVAIDVSGDTESFRSQIYPEYKANREKAPDDFHPQVERCVSLLEQMNVPVLGVEGVEADDVIATLVRRLRREDPELNIRIISRDKDLTQLLDEQVELYDIHKDQGVTPADIFKTEGVEAKHVGDILALMGDTSDNIPGVPGIGPKTAAQLILKYGSIANLLAHLDEIKGKRRENLEASREQIALSRSLVELKEDVAFEFDLASAASDSAALPVESLQATFRELGFNRYQEEVARLGRGSASNAESEATSENSTAESPVFAEGLFAPTDSTVGGRERAGEYEAVLTREELAAVVEAVRTVDAFAVDTETDSLSPLRANLCGVSIAIEAGHAWYIPCRSPEPATHLDPETVLEMLRPVLEDETRVRIGHNLKYDLLVLRRHGVDLAEPMFDTMVASYVVDATRSSHKMDVLALALLDHTCIPITELIGRGKSQRAFDTVPLAQAVEYAAEDADVTLRLHEAFETQLEGMGLRELFDEVEMPLVRVLAELEWNGIHVDPDELDRQREALQIRIDDLRQRIVNEAPHPFSPDSPKQLAVVLFNKPDQDPPGLGLGVIKRGKTGPSTDQEVLERLAGDPKIGSELPRGIIEYRQLTKLVNTYLVALKEAINPETGRVHASFNQTVAATGRLSSSDPNLQNIPIRTDVGREIRRAFTAEAGNELITADYSQIELRLLAHLSGDPALIEAFEQDQDIHTAVAAKIHHVSPNDVTPTQRDGAKMVNFGIIYGITPWGLARRLGGETTVEEAEKIIIDYKRRFGGIDVFLHECVQEAESKGFVETILKRRRAIPQILAQHPQQRALGERMAINSVVQGSAADLIKLAMIRIYREMPGAFPAARMLLQIHDELVFEAPENEAADVQAWVVKRMQAAMELVVPLKVDSARSAVWIDAK